MPVPSSKPKVKFEPQENKTVTYNGKPATVLWEIAKKGGKRAFKIRTKTTDTIATLDELSPHVPKQKTGSGSRQGLRFRTREEQLMRSIDFKQS